MKRRSSLGTALHRAAGANGVPGTPANVLDDSVGPPGSAARIAAEKDEEVERRERRGIQKRTSFGHVGPHPMGGAGAALVGTPLAQSGVAAFSAAQLAEHYTNCMKLSAENKINIKNAFQLKLIDTMAEMLKKKNSDLDNFQAASCALDASTKIYAYRVDSVHNETLKLASGVGTAKGDDAGAAGGQDGADAGDDDQGLDQDGNPRKKKPRKKRSATIEKNLANINCSKFDLEFDTDPLFKKISQQFDSGGGGGQFLHTLPMQDDRCHLLLDSSAIMGIAAAGPELAVGIDPEIDDEKGELPLPKPDESSLICQTFSTFTFRDWTLENDEEHNMSLSQQNDLESGSGDKPAPILPMDLEEHAFDPDDLHDDGGGGADIFDALGGADNDILDEDADNGIGFNKPRVPNALMDVQNLRDHLASVPSEYSYFDTGRLGAWAGPKHWKFKPVSKSLNKVTGAPDTEKEKKKKKDKERVDFDELVQIQDNTIIDFIQKAMTLPQKSIKLQNKTMQNWGEEKTMLPEDLHYMGKDFVKLESMIKSNVAPRKVSQSQEVDDNVDNYDFENANDTENFCPDVEGDEGGYPTGNGTSGEFTGVFSQTMAAPEDQSSAAGGQSGFDLVAAPNKVEKVKIGYAKLAKKVDMRKLKRVQWSILLEKSQTAKETDDKENVADNNDSSEASTSTNSNELSVLPADTKFSDVYSALKTSKEIPFKMLEGLSVPLAFVALLHLCNEETLELKNTADFTDLTIRKG